MKDKLPPAVATDNLATNGSSSASQSDQNKPNPIAAILVALGGFGSAAFWWGLDTLWLSAPPLSGAIAIMLAVGLWCLAGLFFAEQHRLIKWPKSVVMIALVSGMVCGALSIYLSNPILRDLRGAEDIAPQSPIEPVIDLRGAEDITPQSPVKPVIQAPAGQEITGKSRPSPLPDGRYSLVLSIVRPFSLQSPALEIKNVSDTNIDFSVSVFSVSVSGLEIIRDRDFIKGLLPPFATQRIMSDQQLDLEFVKKEEVELDITGEIYYTFSDSKSEKYTNKYIEDFKCTAKMENLSVVECRSRRIYDWVLD